MTGKASKQSLLELRAPPAGRRHLYNSSRYMERGFYWLVCLRWVACSGLFFVIWLASSPLDVLSNPRPLYIICILLALYNAVLLIFSRRSSRLSAEWIERILFWQITIDLIALTLLLYFSGISHNPFILYFVFHITIAGILLPDFYAYLEASLASLMVGAVLAFQYWGLIPEYALNLASVTNGDSGTFLLAKFLAQSSTLLFAAYFTIAVLRYVRYAESEIRQKEKFLSLGELVSGIVHQIKNPLDGLKNCLHHITAGTSEPAVNDKFVALMGEELERIESLTYRLQEYSRPHGIELQPVDINKEINSALKLLQIKDTGKVSIRSEMRPVPKAKADPFALQEVIINLCTNAIAAMPNGGTLTIRTHPASYKIGKSTGGVGVEIIDTGHGIRPEEKDLVFEPFYSTKPRSEGTGLGLWICQMLVSQMGGLLEVESAPGKGATFSLVLQAY